MLAVGVHRLQVIKRGGGVGQFPDALIELALRAPHPAEVEAHDGEADLVKGIVQIIDDTVVHRAAELRVRVQDDRDGCVGLGLGMITAFKAAIGTGKDQFGHGILRETVFLTQFS